MAKKSKKGMMSSLTDVAALTVGAAVASKVVNINLPVPAAAKPALPILLGLFLMKKGGFVGGVGAGMIATGGVKLIGAVAPNLGINATEEISEYVIEGAEDYALSGGEAISEVNSSYALAGMDEEMNADFAG